MNTLRCLFCCGVDRLFPQCQVKENDNRDDGGPKRGPPTPRCPPSQYYCDKCQMCHSFDKKSTLECSSKLNKNDQ